MSCFPIIEKSPRYVFLIEFTKTQLSSMSEKPDTTQREVAPINVNSNSPLENDYDNPPVSWIEVLRCAFPASGGFLFGYDSGYINGCLGSKSFLHLSLTAFQEFAFLY